MHVRQIPLTIQYQVKLNFAIPELFLFLQYHKYHMILIFLYLCCKEILKRKSTPTYDTYCTVLRMTPCRLRKMTNGNVFYIISAKPQHSINLWPFQNITKFTMQRSLVGDFLTENLYNHSSCFFTDWFCVVSEIIYAAIAFLNHRVHSRST